MIENMLFTGVLIAFGGGIYGLLLLLFKTGRRMRGVKIIGGSFAVLIALSIGISIHQDSVATQAGFENYATYSQALGAGVTDPDMWAVQGAAIVAEKEAQRVREAEEAEAARLAVEAEAEDRHLRQAEEAATLEAEEKARREREAEQLAAAEAERIAGEQQEADEERRAGFHCLSPWDGSHREFRNAVRDKMRDPDSFEHVETRVTPVDEDGMHAIIMQYRARNGFGGMNVGTALGQYRNAGCGFVILTIE